MRPRKPVHIDLDVHVAAPVQVVGALFVFERYHQTLGGHLAAARQAPEVQAC